MLQSRIYVFRSSQHLIKYIYEYIRSVYAKDNCIEITLFKQVLLVQYDIVLILELWRSYCWEQSVGKSRSECMDGCSPSWQSIRQECLSVYPSTTLSHSPSSTFSRCSILLFCQRNSLENITTAWSTKMCKVYQYHINFIIARNSKNKLLFIL